MTRPKKSKPQRVLTVLALCKLAVFAPVSLALAQEQGGTVVVFDDLRGSIDQRGVRTTDNLDLNSSAGRRSQLTGEAPAVAGANAPANQAPLPLSPRLQQRALPEAPVPAIFNPASVDQAPQQNIPAEPEQSGTTPVFDTEPFAPTGFRIGTLEGNASLEQSIGYSSNVSQLVDGDGGAFSQTDVALGLTSNWSRHQWQTTLNGSYRLPFDGDEIDRPRFNLNSDLRLDLIDGLTLTTAGFYTAQTQDFTSTTLAPGAIDTPLTQNFGGSIELERSDRKLQFAIRGFIDRDIFEDADLGGGITDSQADLNNTETGFGLRVGYEISPAITPFIDGQYSMRSFDEEVDRNGNRRDSDIFRLRGGIAFDMGEKLQGEVSAGMVNESFDDPALETLSGFTLDGQLQWSPERDTQINLTLGTQTNSSITAGENGTLIYNARLDAERQITNRWALNGFIDYQLETNDDSNTTFGVGVGMEYWVNRFMAMTGDLEYSSFSSDAPDSDFDEFSARVGVRLQR